MARRQNVAGPLRLRWSQEPAAYPPWRGPSNRGPSPRSSKLPYLRWQRGRRRTGVGITAVIQVATVAINLWPATGLRSRKMPDPVWLDVKGAAARVLVSTGTILRAARSGALTGYKVGGHRRWRFRTVDVDAWIASERPSEAPPRKALLATGATPCPVCGSVDIRVWFRHEQTSGQTCLSCGKMSLVCLA
jgi:excisionase family DNA binding protein